MAARKVFHVLVGFRVANKGFIFLYLISTGLYIFFTGTANETNGPLFPYPRYAMILSGPLPLAVGVVIWRTRRYVAMGVVAYGLMTCVLDLMSL